MLKLRSNQILLGLKWDGFSNDEIKKLVHATDAHIHNEDSGPTLHFCSNMRYYCATFGSYIVADATGELVGIYSPESFSLMYGEVG